MPETLKDLLNIVTYKNWRNKFYAEHFVKIYFLKSVFWDKPLITTIDCLHRIIQQIIKIYHTQEQYQIGNVDSRSIKSCHLQNYTQTNFIYKINFTSHFVFITTCFYCCTIGNNSKLTEAAFFCFCTFLDVLTDLLKFVFRSPYKRGLVRAELIPAI